jgi:hypothetical protein
MLFQGFGGKTYRCRAVKPWPYSVVKDGIVREIVERILLDGCIRVRHNPTGTIHAHVTRWSGHAYLGPGLATCKYYHKSHKYHNIHPHVLTLSCKGLPMRDANEKGYAGSLQNEG